MGRILRFFGALPSATKEVFTSLKPSPTYKMPNAMKKDPYIKGLLKAYDVQGGAWDRENMRDELQTEIKKYLRKKKLKGQIDPYN